MLLEHKQANEALSRILTQLREAYPDDVDTVHRLADEILVVFLRNLGFEEAMDAYESIPKWYA